MNGYDRWLDRPLRDLEAAERKDEAIEALMEEEGLTWEEAEKRLLDLQTEAMIDMYEVYRRD